MKENKMAEAINNVDEKYVNEATTYHAKKTVKFRNFKIIGAIAACLCIMLGIGVYQYTYNMKVDSIVAIDVNPSIEIQLSKSEKVIKVMAINEDAQTVLEGLTVEGLSLNEAITVIMDALLENGYLNDTCYSVNVCVENEDEEEGNEVAEEISDEITKVLGAKDLIGNVNTQICPINDENKEAAKELNVSLGKYLLAKRVSEITGFDITETIKFSVRELLELSEAEEIKLITKEEAFAYACTHAGIEAEKVVLIHNIIKEKEDGFAYNIEFVAEEKMFYRYVINATDGMVLEYEYYEITEPEEENKEEEEEKVKLLSKKEVEKIILADAQIEADKIRYTEFKLNEGETFTYYVEFVFENVIYKYTVNAVDGTVVEKTTEEIKQPEENEETEKITVITLEEALNIAMADAGVTMENMERLNVFFKNRRVEAQYKISFMAENVWYEYTIDAVTKEILFKNSVELPEKNEMLRPENKPQEEVPNGEIPENMQQENPEGMKPENDKDMSEENIFGGELPQNNQGMNRPEGEKNEHNGEMNNQMGNNQFQNGKDHQNMNGGQKR